MSDTGEAPGRSGNPVVRVARWMAAGFALLLGATLLVGALLPGAWWAEAAWTVQAPPERIYPLLAAPERWDEWTPWPGMAFSYDGPSSGVGARRTWDDPGVGAGSFTVVDAEPPSLIRYRVEVDGGEVVTRGAFRLERTDAGTRVSWREEGDFGANPLLGWAALSMRRNHGAELERRLHDLATAAEARPPP